MPTDPICSHPECRELATHILLTERAIWTRKAVLASAAPEVLTAAPPDTPVPTLRARPSAPYYCKVHAEEKSMGRARLWACVGLPKEELR